MAFTVLGMGTKQAPANVNLDPQKQFWSHLSAYINKESPAYNDANSRVGYISGFECRQNSPGDMSVLIGGGDAPDSAVIELADNRMVLISTDGTPQKVTLPTAPSAGNRYDAVVSYIDTTSSDAGSETPGTPSYIKTIVVSKVGSSPTNSDIVAKLPAGAGGQYYRWCDVRLTANQAVVSNSSITNKKPASPNVYCKTVPDYSRVQTISSDTFIAPSDGIVLFYALLNTTEFSSYSVKVNSETVAAANYSAVTGGYNLQMSNEALVAKGNTVTFSITKGSWNYRKFVPFKMS